MTKIEEQAKAERKVRAAEMRKENDEFTRALKRDIFATAALEGLLAGVVQAAAEYSPGRAKQFAGSAYALADAMLEARKEKKS